MCFCIRLSFLKLFTLLQYAIHLLAKHFPNNTIIKGVLHSAASSLSVSGSVANRNLRVQKFIITFNFIIMRKSYLPPTAECICVDTFIIAASNEAGKARNVSYEEEEDYDTEGGWGNIWGKMQ